MDFNARVDANAGGRTDRRKTGSLHYVCLTGATKSKTIFHFYEMLLLTKYPLYLRQLCVSRGKTKQKQKASEPVHSIFLQSSYEPTASAQSDQSFHCPSEDALYPWLPSESPAKTQIRLHGCVGLSESSLGLHVALSKCCVPSHL